MRRLGFVVALALIGGGAAWADQPTGTTGTTGTTGGTMGAAQGQRMGDQGDRTFVEKMATGGMAEVKLSKLAMDRSKSMEVKQFARKMVEDHHKANTELKQIADRKDLAMPMQLDDKHQKIYDKLSGMSGADFDKEYMKTMSDDHEDTVKLLKNEMQNGQDADLRSFATKTLPVVQKHTDMAHMDENAVKKESSGKEQKEQKY